ncbi:MAG: hypothetical protein IPM92_10165 [Saprospiraceae bacterium]|nr:hypothetical protein [Saprospiraceae bacterium]
MKTTILRFAYLLIIGLSFQSCLKDECTHEVEYVEWSPVYMSLDEMRNEIKLALPKENKNPGKIYVYNDYLLINEFNEGIHVIDNSNPQAPVNKGFIAISGNIDMAVSNNILYADNFANLLSIDIHDCLNPKLVDFKAALFNLYGKNSDGKYLVKYKSQIVKRTQACGAYPDIFYEGDFVLTAVGSKKTGPNANTPARSSGIGGSFARFTIQGDFLYIVNHNELNTYSIINPFKPELKSSQKVAWDIETIFPHDEYLFIGARSGMYIFSIEQPASPLYLSKFVHANACDPVYVDQNLAYVTLRSGTECNGFTNQLEIIDVRDLLKPSLLRKHDMKNPHGLSVDQDLMVLCEGEYGFKTMQLLPDAQIHEYGLFKSHAAYDVIMLSPELVIIIGKDGLYQYNLENPSQPKLLSKI